MVQSHLNLPSVDFVYSVLQVSSVSDISFDDNFCLYINSTPVYWTESHIAHNCINIMSGLDL